MQVQRFESIQKTLIPVYFTQNRPQFVCKNFLALTTGQWYNKVVQILFVTMIKIHVLARKENPMVKLLLYYLLVINAAGLLFCGLDKWKAKRGAWRIPEKVLFGMAFLGGGFGVWAGMYLFRHKTRHWNFVLFMPLITLSEYAMLFWLLLCNRGMV